MKLSHQILLDLASGQCTPSALAERFRQPASVLQAFCEDLQIDGLAEPIPIENPAIGPKLTAWRITPAGRELAAKLPSPALP